MLHLYKEPWLAKRRTHDFKHPIRVLYFSIPKLLKNLFTTCAGGPSFFNYLLIFILLIFGHRKARPPSFRLNTVSSDFLFIFSSVSSQLTPWLFLSMAWRRILLALFIYEKLPLLDFFRRPTDAASFIYLSREPQLQLRQSGTECGAVSGTSAAHKWN